MACGMVLPEKVFCLSVGIYWWGSMHLEEEEEEEGHLWKGEKGGLELDGSSRGQSAELKRPAPTPLSPLLTGQGEGLFPKVDKGGQNIIIIIIIFKKYYTISITVVRD